MEKSETRVYPFLVRMKYSHALILQDPGTQLPSQRVALSALPTGTSLLKGAGTRRGKARATQWKKAAKIPWQILEFRVARSYGVLSNPMLSVARPIVCPYRERDVKETTGLRTWMRIRKTVVMVGRHPLQIVHDNHPVEIGEPRKQV